ncbi:MAG TPA: site-2 protease family protein [Vicinamibacteria bacterium]
MSSFKIARIFGIPILIHFTWFIIFGLIVYTLATGYFPSQYPGLPQSSYLVRGIVTALLLFASVLLHELGHSVVALRNGIAIDSITLFIFGGVARWKEDPKSAWVEFKIAIAGPITSFLLAGAFFAVSRLAVGGQGMAAVARELALLNLVLGIFNLVPAFPLDGGRVLRATIWRFTGKVRATRFSSMAGTVFAYFLIVSGVFRLVGGDLYGLWAILIGWFIKEAASGAYQQVQVDEVLSRVRVKELMVTECASIPAHVSVEDAVNNYFLRYGYGGFPVESEGKLKGLISLSDVRDLDREDWPRTSVQSVMTAVDEGSTISVEANIVEAMRKMAASGLGRLIAVDGSGECVGMITHNGILRRLQVQEKLGV